MTGKKPEREPARAYSAQEKEALGQWWAHQKIRAQPEKTGDHGYTVRYRNDDQQAAVKEKQVDFVRKAPDVVVQSIEHDFLKARHGAVVEV